MEKAGVFVCLMIVLLDFAAGFLGIQAHVKRLECRQPNDEAFELGLIAAVLLALSHVSANLLGGCMCICCTEKLENKSSGIRKFWFGCLDCSGGWISSAGDGNAGDFEIKRDVPPALSAIHGITLLDPEFTIFPPIPNISQLHYLSPFSSSKMGSKNQNKPPFQHNTTLTTTSTTITVPFKKYSADAVSEDKGRRLGFEKMVGTANNGRPRLAFSLVNGSQDLGSDSAPPSVAGSECGGIEFTREDAEALVNEKMKYKNKFNYKERCENMMECSGRLCTKLWVPV
ncbi:uncharacterized protein LOC120179469 [Hibiscus syriacus]|uniref:uncharacterized protein LOC120179469 n=1 Tax=Hibiscus syriacus TaxID=106335 RepID=UPI001924934C|nr:uncharacterized protein LOC120179469 [Hibiscus syriacus]